MGKLRDAALWWSKAAEQQDPEAQFNLAQMLAKGQGVDRDSELAFHWYERAALQGVAGAQSRLGILYATGEGVASDPIEAHKWFSIAAQSGDAAALANVKRSAGQLTPVQAREGERRASAWRLTSPGQLAST
jgi:TPR repeat protein